MTEKRTCIWLDETCEAPNMPGMFIPSLVTENEPGHSPLAGDPAKFQSPWYFGPGIHLAKRQVDQMNEELGVSPEDALEIVLSSMFPVGHDR